MKSLAKYGVLGLLGGGVVLFSTSVNAGSKAEAFADAQVVRQAQAQAIAEKDTFKTACLNDKLVQINPLLNVLEAQVTPDQGLIAQIHELRVAADSCIGRKQMHPEGSSNSFTTPEGATPPNDPTDPGIWGEPFEPTGYASPISPNSPRRFGHASFGGHRVNVGGGGHSSGRRR